MTEFAFLTSPRIHNCTAVFLFSLGDLTCLFAHLFSHACIIAKLVPSRRRGESSSLLLALHACHRDVWRLFSRCARWGWFSSFSASCMLLVFSSSSCRQRRVMRDGPLQSWLFSAPPSRCFILVLGVFILAFFW